MACMAKVNDKYIYARDLVSRLSRKYDARRGYIWDTIEDELNIDKGDGAIIDKEDAEHIESIIADGMANIAEFDGIKVKIPRGYYGPDENGIYTDRRGGQFALVQYGWKDSATICLESVHSKRIRTIELEIV